MTSIVIIVFVIVLSAYFFIVKKKSNQANERASKTKQTKKNTSPYRSVVIEPAHQACQAAKSLENTPILMSEAPALPLPSCDQESCNCKFIKYDDRRQEKRRSLLHVARQQIGEDAINNRKGSDRRESE